LGPSPLNSRILIEQAKGVIAHTCHVDAAENVINLRITV
jgi:hypothetical protein